MMKVTALSMLWLIWAVADSQADTTSQARVFQVHSDPEVSVKNKTRACYYANNRVNATDIPPDLCTHIIFASAVVTADGIVPAKASDVIVWRELVKLKENNPTLKILLSTSFRFESVVGKGPGILQSFLDGTKRLLQTYDLDGVDLDWELPGLSKRWEFIAFQKALSAMLKSEGKLLTAALPCQLLAFLESYSPAAVNEYFDFVTVMTYDLHQYTPHSPYTDYNSPLHPSAVYMDRLRYIAGLMPSKLILGYATYGRSWKLADPNQHGLHAKATDEGPPGPYLHVKGYSSMADVCLEVKAGGKVVEDPENGAEYMYHGDTWVSYNGMYSAKIEADWILANGIGGVAFFALDFADYKNVCGYGEFPVFNKVKSILTGL